MEIRYCNTDLDLVSSKDLSPLVEAFTSCVRGDDGNWHATFETDYAFLDPDPNIAALLTTIEALSEPLKDLWNSCSLREFNIGYDCGDQPWAFNNKISVKNLQRMAQSNIALRITLYPGDR